MREEMDRWEETTLYGYEFDKPDDEGRYFSSHITGVQQGVPRILGYGLSAGEGCDHLV